jgi:hypothetical protein
MFGVNVNVVHKIIINGKFLIQRRTKLWFEISKNSNIMRFYERSDDCLKSVDDHPAGNIQLSNFEIHKECSIPTSRSNTFEVVNTGGREQHMFSSLTGNHTIYSSTNDTLDSEKLEWIAALEFIKNTLSDQSPTPSSQTENKTKTDRVLGREGKKLFVPPPPPMVDESLLLIDETTNEVKGGTVEKLVECLWNSPYACKHHTY